MHGAIFLLLYRRGGQLPGTATGGVSAYCVVAMDSYTAGAATDGNYHAGATRGQSFHAGGVAVVAFTAGAVRENSYQAGASAADHC